MGRERGSGKGGTRGGTRERGLDREKKRNQNPNLGNVACGERECVCMCVCICVCVCVLCVWERWGRTYDSRKDEFGGIVAGKPSLDASCSVIYDNSRLILDL